MGLNLQNNIGLKEDLDLLSFPWELLGSHSILEDLAWDLVSGFSQGNLIAVESIVQLNGKMIKIKISMLRISVSILAILMHKFR